MTRYLLTRPLFCQNAEAHLKQNYSKDFKPIHTTLSLHRIMRQGYLRACGRNWQDFQDQLWIRDAFTNSALDHGAIVVYGHTISEQAELLPNRIGLDTDPYYSGVLTCPVLEGTEQRLLQTGVDK
jgi:hypothetical protein